MNIPCNSIIRSDFLHMKETCIKSTLRYKELDYS